MTSRGTSSSKTELDNGQTFFFSRPCLHCQDAPCVEVCPVQATYHREDGLVVMDYDRCIGCRYCEVACPYDARKFNWAERTDVNPYIPTWGIAEVERRPRGVVEKCTFCIHRIDAGLATGLMPGVDRDATPACVNACPVGARIFGNLKDREQQSLAGHCQQSDVAAARRARHRAECVLHPTQEGGVTVATVALPTKKPSLITPGFLAWLAFLGLCIVDRIGVRL